jgi:hypothetical protein
MTNWCVVAVVLLFFLNGQDGASAHTAKVVTSWLNEQEFDRIPNWPANSPDLNPIENVWGMLAQRVSYYELKTLDQLRDAITAEWDKITYDEIQALIESVPNRYQSVIDANGGNTRY